MFRVLFYSTVAFIASMFIFLFSSLRLLCSSCGPHFPLLPLVLISYFLYYFRIPSLYVSRFILLLLYSASSFRIHPFTFRLVFFLGFFSLMSMRFLSPLSGMIHLRLLFSRCPLYLISSVPIAYEHTISHNLLSSPHMYHHLNLSSSNLSV